MEDRHQALLLGDLNRFAQDFWENEKIGDTRVNFFFTVSTAVIAAIVTIIASDKLRASLGIEIAGATFVEAGIIVLSFVFMFGVVTVFRLIKRDIRAEEYKYASRLARSILALQGLEEYHPYWSPLEKRNEDQRQNDERHGNALNVESQQGTNLWKRLLERRTGFGGLVDLVAVVTGCIATLLCFFVLDQFWPCLIESCVFLWHGPPWALWLFATLVGTVCAVVLIGYSKTQRTLSAKQFDAKFRNELDAVRKELGRLDKHSCTGR